MNPLDILGNFKEISMSWRPPEDWINNQTVSKKRESKAIHWNRMAEISAFLLLLPSYP
jgi:hypothetical protein